MDARDVHNFPNSLGWSFVYFSFNWTLLAFVWSGVVGEGGREEVVERKKLHIPLSSAWKEGGHTVNPLVAVLEAFRRGNDENHVNTITMIQILHLSTPPLIVISQIVGRCKSHRNNSWRDLRSCLFSNHQKRNLTLVLEPNLNTGSLFCGHYL